VKPNEDVYIQLQKHLDNQAIGFPATRSGVELKILKHIFSPQEAEIASYLSYRMEPLETIYGRVGHLVEFKIFSDLDAAEKWIAKK
jgi:electron transport complex protein RnfB